MDKEGRTKYGLYVLIALWLLVTGLFCLFSDPTLHRTASLTALIRFPNIIASNIWVIYASAKGFEQPIPRSIPLDEKPRLEDMAATLRSFDLSDKFREQRDRVFKPFNYLFSLLFCFAGVGMFWKKRLAVRLTLVLLFIGIVISLIGYSQWRSVYHRNLEFTLLLLSIILPSSILCILLLREVRAKH